MLMSQRSNNYVFAYDGSMKSFVQWKTFFRITKSNTIDGAIKRWLVHFELPIQKLRGHIYDGGSNLMGKKSGVAQQILKQLPKALITHCHGYLPSFSIKDANNAKFKAKLWKPLVKSSCLSSFLRNANEYLERSMKTLRYQVMVTALNELHSSCCPHG